MPTYEFRCPDGHDFEKFYRTISSAEFEAACPVCGKPSERRISRSGFAFKGSGFYLTDYGKNAHRNTGDAKPSDNKAGGSSSGDAKSDSSTSTSAPATGASESKPAAAPPKPSSSE